MTNQVKRRISNGLDRSGRGAISGLGLLILALTSTTSGGASFSGSGTASSGVFMTGQAQAFAIGNARTQGSLRSVGLSDQGAQELRRVGQITVEAVRMLTEAGEILGRALELSAIVDEYAYGTQPWRIVEDHVPRGLNGARNDIIRLKSEARRWSEGIGQAPLGFEEIVTMNRDLLNEGLPLVEQSIELVNDLFMAAKVGDWEEYDNINSQTIRLVIAQLQLESASGRARMALLPMGHPERFLIESIVLSNNAMVSMLDASAELIMMESIDVETHAREMSMYIEQGKSSVVNGQAATSEFLDSYGIGADSAGLALLESLAETYQESFAIEEAIYGVLVEVRAWLLAVDEAVSEEEQERLAQRFEWTSAQLDNLARARVDLVARRALMVSEFGL